MRIPSIHIHKRSVNGRVTQMSNHYEYELQTFILTYCMSSGFVIRQEVLSSIARRVRARSLQHCISALGCAGSGQRSP